MTYEAARDLIWEFEDACRAYQALGTKEHREQRDEVRQRLLAALTAGQTQDDRE